MSSTAESKLTENDVNITIASTDLSNTSSITLVMLQHRCNIRCYSYCNYFCTNDVNIPANELGQQLHCKMVRTIAGQSFDGSANITICFNRFI